MLTQVVVAVDEEDDADLAVRVLAWWRERPGGGNRADWVDWATSQDGIESAFVYPLRHDTLGDGTLGAVTLVVLGPPPTTETAAGEPASSAYRFIDTGSDGEEGTLADLQALIEGTGTHATEGGKASAAMDSDDIFVKTASALPQAISLALTLGSTYAWSFTGTFTLDSGSSASQLKGTGGAPTGLAAGDWIAIPDTSVRGAFAYRQVASVSWPDVNLTVPLDSSPTAGLVVRPLPQYGSGLSATTNAHAIRDAVLALIDALGPGQGTAPSERWPADGGASYPSTLYKSAVTAAVMGVPGLSGAPAGVNGISNVVVTLTASPDPEFRAPRCGRNRHALDTDAHMKFPLALPPGTDTFDHFARELVSLLGWTAPEGTLLAEDARVLGKALADAWEALDDAGRENFVTLAEQLLSEWESRVGVPLSPGSATADRQYALTAKRRSTGGNTRGRVLAAARVFDTSASIVTTTAQFASDNLDPRVVFQLGSGGLAGGLSPVGFCSFAK